MSKLPWFAQYPSDFIAGISGMPGEEIGVYSVLLNLMYARRSKLPASRPKDQQELARTCGITTRRFNQLVDALIARGPKKIYRDADGCLSNARFDKWLASSAEIPAKNIPGKNSPQNEAALFPNNDLETNTPHKAPQAQKRPKNAPQPPPPSIISEKNGKKPEIIMPQNEATFIDSNDLQAHSRARVRPRNQKVSKYVSGGSGGSAETPPPEHTQSEDDFKTWTRACRRTIPKGWKHDLALKRWLKLPAHPVATWIAAWDAYIAHNRQQSEKAKWVQRTAYPENWWSTGAYRDFLDEVLHQAEQQDKKRAARATAIEHWGQFGPAIIAKLGEAMFDAWLLDASFHITAPQQATLVIPRTFALKYLREHGEIVRKIENVTNTAITLVQHQRQTA